MVKLRRKALEMFFVFFAVLVNSCGSSPCKYSPGDTWNIQLTSDFSLECNLKELNGKQLIFDLNKTKVEDSYNFAIKADFPSDYILVNNKTIFAKSSGVIPISYYEVEDFCQNNTVEIPFRAGTEVFRKVNIEPYDSFWREGHKDYKGIKVVLYTK